MARRKRKEEEPIWEPPEFDEVGYMRKEIESAKISLVVIAWAAVGALLGYLLFALNLPIVGFILGLFIFGVLYFLLPMLGLPIHGFKRRDWISHASIYFFSWLAFSILLLNPPFGDHTSPVIGSFEVGTFGTSNTTAAPAPGTMVCVSASPGQTLGLKPGFNKSFYLIFRATDNVQVSNVTVTVNDVPATYTPLSGLSNMCVGTNLLPFSQDTYGLRIPIITVTNYAIIITAVDSSKLRTVASLNLQTT